MTTWWADGSVVGDPCAVVVATVVGPSIVAVVVMVVPGVVPVAVGNAAVVVPVEGPTQAPAERHPGAVGDQRVVDGHRAIDVDDLWVVLRNIDDLRIRWLDADDLFLNHDDLFVVVREHPLGIGLGADQLDGVVDILLLEVDGFAERGCPGDVLSHHRDHIAKLHE
jgi:hypothetical protein